MSKQFDPTPNQKKAIEERDHEIVVSAAAGSGKTTVLINRIIKMIINGECSVDEFLIVTFTRAATAEIRSRLATAITEALKKNPHNQNLIKQQMLVPSANIYTIDAFCGNIVRENFESAKVNPDFKVLQGGTESTYKKEALLKSMAYFYEENSKEFEILNSILTYGYGDTTESYVDQIYRKIQAYKYPDELLEHSIDLYKPGTKTVDIAIKNFLDYANYLISGLEKGMERFKDNETIINIVSPDLVAFKEVKSLIENKDFDSAFAYERNKKINWSNKSFEDPNNIEVLNFKFYRDSMNKLIDKDCDQLKKYFGYGTRYLEKDLEVQYSALLKLLEIVKLYSKTYDEIKKEHNSLDFSDIEHIAYNLLMNKDGTKTDLAKDLSSSYKQILIDEYQDTNELQDGIFVALSNEAKNLFIVGDVKQSIYGFRNAMPELFIEKKTHEGGITLGENFRSNAGVIDFVNFVFDQVMTKTCGDINYQDPSERLEHGKDDKKDPNRVDVELRLIEGNKTNSIIYETNYIIEYIRQKLKEDQSLNYGDFAILMRNVKSNGVKVMELLEDANIPVIFDGGAAFLETADVKTMISLLHTIDNPLLDVHLLATLMSPIFNFSPDDIARLKVLNNKKGSLYVNLIKAENEDEKFKNALDMIRRYRKFSITMPVAELIRLIYDETLYPDIAASMPNGIQRQANLLLLRDYADEYEQNNEVGIGNFVRYLDDLIENDINPDSSSLVSGSTNAVKLMTIHKSKGLEFKYCIIMDLARTIIRDSHNLIIGDNLQLGIKSCNPETLDILPSFVYSQIQNSNIYKEMAEELRVLYVGMTRAKEKLILLGTLGTATQKATVFKHVADIISSADFDDKTGTINPYAIAKAKSFLDIIIMATIRHSNAPALRTENYATTLISEMPIVCSIEQAMEELDTEVLEELSTDINKEKLKEISERMDYEYPYAKLSSIPTKRSASSTESAGFNPQYFANAIPEFMTTSKLTAAQKGTCLHRFMQYADFDKAKKNPEQELNTLIQKGYFTEIEAHTIDLEKIKEFFNSNIYKRIEKSNNVMREKKFAVLIPAEEFSEDLPEELRNETVLIQGIADCVFEENGEYVILDYKTDRTTSEEELIERYKDQLYTYRRALADVLGKPISDTLLYAFSLGKEIEI